MNSQLLVYIYKLSNLYLPNSGKEKIISIIISISSIH